jgi:hypothetical protein
MQIEQLVLPENEQDFLERQANILKSLDPVGADSKPSLEQPKVPEHKSPSKDKSDYQAKIARLLEQSNSIREKKASGDAIDKTVGTNNEVLNNFFQSLLTKKQSSKERRKSSASSSEQKSKSTE